MIAVLIIILLSALLFLIWNLTYWRRKGLLVVKTPFRKKLVPMVYIAESLQYYKDLKKLNRFHGGRYIMAKPVYIPMNPELIKRILTKDFPYFSSHGTYINKEDILTNHLFAMDGGEDWKNLRVKLTPTFTSGKMKMMFDTLVEKTVGLKDVVDTYAINGEGFDIKDVVARFTTDIIASCAFGIECDSLHEPDNEFRLQGKKLFEFRWALIWKRWLTAVVPHKLLGKIMKLHGDEMFNFFSKVVKDTIQLREEKEIYRKDFMHLLLQLKNQGKTSDDTSISNNKKNDGKIHFTDEEIMAQCFVFYLAGFETSSTTMTFTLLSLSQDQEIQKKLRDDINQALNQTGGEMTYDAIMNMTYLDKVVKETLRKYPALTILPRVCTKNYDVPGTDVVIEKGTRVQIPVLGLQMDPEYWPNPEKFDPERFSPENVATRHEFTYMPFGEGPRMCIGLRFGLMQVKVGLAYLVKNYNFTINDKTLQPITLSNSLSLIGIKGDLWLNASKV